MKRGVHDYGHGGTDPGALGPRGLREADINLAIGKRVTELLSSVVDVVPTRTADTTVELHDRAQLANQMNADYFVSIHCNAATASSAHGTETFSYPGAPNGKRLATEIHKRLVVATGLTDRGLKEADFAVLRETNMAAALVEIAFITNPGEEQMLSEAAFQERVATAIAEGIAAYLGLVLTTSNQVVVLREPEIKLIEGRAYAPVRTLCDRISSLVDIHLLVNWNVETQSAEIRMG